MKKILRTSMVLALTIFTFPAKAQEKYQDINLYAECSAIFSVLASEKTGRLEQEISDNFFAVSAKFYELALAKGGEDMKAVYDAKVQDLKGVTRNNAVEFQQKKALEKQCRLAAIDLDIKIKK